jgi:acyl-CoA thioesterase FadM
MSMLTPGYGSPEQLAGEMVTTASDIYQTGLVLYELLTGRRHDTKAPRALLAEPPLPSELLRGGPRHVQVRGDLDAITRKAMHCDPAQRYGSAGEMVADLQNYLAGRAVTAQADTLRYRLAKLNKRKPWLLPAVVVGVLVIAAYLVTLTLYARQLKVEQQRSLAAQAFLVEILRSPDPFSPADPELVRHVGHPFTEWRDGGLESPVLESYLRYRQPLHFDDLVDVRLRLAAVTRTTFQMAYLLTVHDPDGDVGVRATGVTVHGCVTTEGRPTRLPAWLVELGAASTR